MNIFGSLSARGWIYMFLTYYATPCYRKKRKIKLTQELIDYLC